MRDPFTSRAAPSGAPALPARAGLGLKPAHFADVLERRPGIGFFEIHAENYMVEGGPFHHALHRIRTDYALSVHGVALSIGGEEPLDGAHLERLRQLLDRYQPAAFSEHLAWSSHAGAYFNDLLPMAYDAASLARVCAHVDQVQATLRRRMLLENPATYLAFGRSTMDEADFIAEVVRRTGCGLLLDVNNVYVSAVNHRRDAHAYLRALPLEQVGEIHLAGFATQEEPDGEVMLIDDHGAPVAEAVWALYEEALAYTGPVATLIERDNRVPPLNVLEAEAALADARLAACGMHAGARP